VQYIADKEKSVHLAAPAISQAATSRRPFGGPRNDPAEAPAEEIGYWLTVLGSELQGSHSPCNERRDIESVKSPSEVFALAASAVSKG